MPSVPAVSCTDRSTSSSTPTPFSCPEAPTRHRLLSGVPAGHRRRLQLLSLLGGSESGGKSCYFPNYVLPGSKKKSWSFMGTVRLAVRTRTRHSGNTTLSFAVRTKSGSMYCLLSCHSSSPSVPPCLSKLSACFFHGRCQTVDRSPSPSFPIGRLSWM